MRGNLDAAIARGVSVGVFGANACYWQVRFENTIVGAACVMVCYKMAWGFGVDPEVLLHPEYTTTTWRDPVLGRPEQQLMGVMYFNWANGPSLPFFAINTSSWPSKPANRRHTSSRLRAREGTSLGLCPPSIV